MVPRQREGVVDVAATTWSRIDAASPGENPPFEAMLTFERVEGGTRIESNIDLFMRGPARLFGGVFTRWYGKS